MAIPFWIVKGNPLGIAFFVSLVGVVSTVVTYRVASTFFKPRTGLLAALFYAGSFLMAIYDRKYWNASFIPLLSLLTIFSLYKISLGKSRWSILLALLLTIAFHAHMTSGVLLILVILSWFIFKLPVKNKETIIAIAIFIILQLPLLLFEFRHDFTNSRALINFISKKSQATPLLKSTQEVGELFINTSARLFYLPGNIDIADELTLCKQYAQKRFKPPLWLAGLLLSAVLLFIISKRKNPAYKLLLLSLAVNFFSLVWYRSRAGDGNWYPGQLSEYFFFPSFPLIFIALASAVSTYIDKLNKQKWIFMLFLFIIFATNTQSLLSAKHSDNYKLKLNAVRQALLGVGQKPFSLEVTSSDPCRLYGYRYLFSYFQIEPVQSYLDPQFMWLYEKRLLKTDPLQQVIIRSEKEKVQISIEDLTVN